MCMCVCMCVCTHTHVHTYINIQQAKKSTRESCGTRLHGLQHYPKWLNMGKDHWPDYICRFFTNVTFLSTRTYAAHNHHQPLAPFPTCPSYTNTDLPGICIRLANMLNIVATLSLHHTTNYTLTDLLLMVWVVQRCMPNSQITTWIGHAALMDRRYLRLRSNLLLFFKPSRWRLRLLIHQLSHVGFPDCYPRSIPGFRRAPQQLRVQ